jgi:hypothetical protein
MGRICSTKHGPGTNKRHSREFINIRKENQEIGTTNSPGPEMAERL